MSRYQELAELAVTRASNFFNRKTRCTEYAIAFSRRYVEFLGANQEVLTFSMLDNTLRRIRQDAVSKVKPELVQGDDGYWYFGLTIRYEIENSNVWSEDTLAIGLNLEVQGFSVKVESSSPELVAGTEAETALFSSMYSLVLASMQDAGVQASRRIGFVS